MKKRIISVVFATFLLVVGSVAVVNAQVDEFDPTNPDCQTFWQECQELIAAMAVPATVDGQGRCLNLEECWEDIDERDLHIVDQNAVIYTLGGVPLELPTPTPVADEQVSASDTSGSVASSELLTDLESQMVDSLEFICIDEDYQLYLSGVYGGSIHEELEDYNDEAEWNSNPNITSFFELRSQYQTALVEVGSDEAAPSFTEVLVMADERWEECSTGRHLDNSP